MAKQKLSQKKTNYEAGSYAPGKINVKIIKSHGREYRQRWIYVPAQLIDAGTFPFSDNEPVLLIVDKENDQVLIQHMRPQLPTTTKK